MPFSCPQIQIPSLRKHKKMVGKQLNVLCFGDSLTSGYCHYGMESYPYSGRLENRLVSALPGRKVEVFTNGVPGDVASTRPFKTRLQVEREFTAALSSCCYGSWALTPAA